MCVLVQITRNRFTLYTTYFPKKVESLTFFLLTNVMKTSLVEFQVKNKYVNGLSWLLLLEVLLDNFK